MSWAPAPGIMGLSCLCLNPALPGCHVLVASKQISLCQFQKRSQSPGAQHRHTPACLLLPAGTKVLRVMPNLPCMVQEGAVVFARGSCAGEQEAALLKSLLSTCGLCEETPESYIDIHTGVSGSGVAYVYLFAEALAEGAVKMGMPSALANKIAAQTLLGAAKMILETGEHPAKLRSDVCTPGGTTIHALHELEKGALRATVMNAVEVATVRARELGKR
ncbi:pyrroline-5-carboxylate reductase 3 isoform X2 [Lepidochelys kempii]|uniref:pyrroline-5-carboxylate reductase 3 isoform X2 n=1 Tax=Lepidochelys kempii TaxID=8472 RepID=UPI003C6F7B64